jgi:hypothetical protein
MIRCAAWLDGCPAAWDRITSPFLGLVASRGERELVPRPASGSRGVAAHANLVIGERLSDPVQMPSGKQCALLDGCRDLPGGDGDVFWRCASAESDPDGGACGSAVQSDGGEDMGGLGLPGVAG